MLHRNWRYMKKTWFFLDQKVFVQCETEKLLILEQLKQCFIFKMPIKF